MICPFCKNELENKTGFCPTCGAKLDNAFLEANNIEKPKKKSEKKASRLTLIPSFVLTGVALFCFIFVFIFFLVAMDDESAWGIILLILLGGLYIVGAIAESVISLILCVVRLCIIKKNPIGKKAFVWNIILLTIDAFVIVSLFVMYLILKIYR